MTGSNNFGWDLPAGVRQMDLGGEDLIECARCLKMKDESELADENTATGEQICRECEREENE